MNDLFNELLQLLDKTSVTVEFDRTKVGYMNYGQSEDDEGLEPNEEDKYFYYTLKVDGYSNLTKYSERVDLLIENINEEVESRIDNKLYYKDVKNRLTKLKSIVVPIYSQLDINFFSDQIEQHQRIIGPKRSYYFQPNIFIKYLNGNALDSDFGEFRIIEKFVEKKFYFAKRMIALVENSLERLNEDSTNKKSGTLKFQNEKILNNPKLVDFQKKLIDYNLIEKLNAAIFAKCFSGNEVEVKINWINTEVSLVFFIKQLDSMNLIVKKEKWIALSNSFLLNSEPIDHKKISHTTSGCKIAMKKIINNCINELVAKPTIPAIK